MNRAPLVFAAGVLAGAGLVAAFVKTAQTTAPPDDALSRRLDGIESDLRFFSTALTERPAQLPTSSGAASPSPLVDARLDDILARLDELAAQVGALAAPVGGDAVAAESGGTEAVKRRGVEPLPDALPEAPANFAAFAALTGREMDELTQQHQLWTYEQVGEAYGRPKRVAPSPNGIGIKYYYELADGRSFIFWFTDGKVVGAFWNE